MSANTAALVTTGGSAVIGAATVSFLGVEIPTFSLIMAITMSVLVRLWVNRKSAKTHISLMDNLLLSSISVILSVGVVIEYKLGFFWTVMVSAGIAFSGEAVLVTLSDQILGVIKDLFAVLKKKIGIGSTPAATPTVTPTNASKTPAQVPTAPTPTPSTPSSPDDPDA